VPVPPTATRPADRRFGRFCSRHFVLLAAAVLGLAALNLGYRLGSELVTDWDEAMYAMSALEMVSSGDWVATTIHGQLDYYNTKPPLNIWLIALSFKAFGTSLVSLRLASAAAAWLTVLVLIGWARRIFGAPTALLAGGILATNFGFIYVHAGRSANPDALLALLILVTVMTLHGAERVPWRAILLAPLMAAVFLLKGSAVLMAGAIIGIVALIRWRANRAPWIHLAAGVPVFVLVIGSWVLLRWRIDRWEFLRRVVYDDFVGHTLDVLDGHRHGPLFFVNLLQKHEYGWLLAIAVALACGPLVAHQWRPRFRRSPARSGLRVVLAAWVAITLLVPTLMQTKLPWYLNPFYPAFALGSAWLLSQSLVHTVASRRRVVLVGAMCIVFAAAESRLVWYSYAHRDMSLSVQGLLLSRRSELCGGVVFATHWNNAEIFVMKAFDTGEPRVVADLTEFLNRSNPGDFILWPAGLVEPTLTLVDTNGRHWLYRRAHGQTALSRGLPGVAASEASAQRRLGRSMCSI
jgi:4-amino-4-deoxy-L-arabinose transferase-like glycosyltransferase